MNDLLTDYMQHLRRRNLASRTLVAYGQILRPFVASVDPMTATTDDIERWLDGRDLGPRARVTYAGCLKGLFAWMVDHGIRAEDPSVRVVRPRLPQRLPRPISTAQLEEAIRCAPDARMRLWLCLAAYAGLRVHEIAGLRLADIDTEHGQIRLRVAKGDKPRVIPLADAVCDAFARYPKPSPGPLFPARVGGYKPSQYPITARSVSIAISEHLHDLGIDATAHQLRHFFGTELYRRTRDIRLVGDLMGHVDPKTTAGYVKLVPSRSAVDAVRTIATPAVEASA